MKPDIIILHHSLTRDSDTVSWGAIRNFHIVDNKYSDIGYHFGIENLRGQTEILMGRMPNQAGAHCKGNNSGTLGICFVGNFDIEPPPIENWNAGIKLVEFLMVEYGIKKIVGHTEYNSHKTCPGKYFDLNKFRKELGL